MVDLDSPEYGSGPADQDAVRDAWLSCVKPANARGSLEKITTVKGVSPRGRDIARRQNHWLTRRSFAMPAGYAGIRWNHDN